MINKLMSISNDQVNVLVEEGHGLIIGYSVLGLPAEVDHR